MVTHSLGLIETLNQVLCIIIASVIDIIEHVDSFIHEENNISHASVEHDRVESLLYIVYLQ